MSPTLIILLYKIFCIYNIYIYIYIYTIMGHMLSHILSLLLYAQRHSSGVRAASEPMVCTSVQSAFLWSLLVWLLSAQYVHQFSPAGSRAYLAIYEQSWSLVEQLALKVKGHSSIDALLS